MRRTIETIHGFGGRSLIARGGSSRHGDRAGGKLTAMATQSDSAVHSGPATDPKLEATRAAASRAAESTAESDTPADPAERRRSWLQGLGAAGTSLVVHVLALVVLALAVVPGGGGDRVATLVSEVMEEAPLEEPEMLAVELEEDLEAATEITDALTSSAPSPVESAAAAVTQGAAGVQLNRDSMEEISDAPIGIDSPVLSLPGAKLLGQAVPDGTLGDARAVVGNYQEALDRITQEIMWMLEKGPVLVVWCFDQSESMKDDQAEISRRIDKVYQELGLLETAQGDQLLTAVTSYGKGFAKHLDKPTSDLEKIRKAIDSVPIDRTGIENMCQAVGQAVNLYRGMARRRQMALILVSDESGDPKSNRQYLEAAIAEARSAKCRIYTLGREAVFGYPKAYMRWQHPQTKRIHWLPVDRGPETAFVEQLQTNGLRRRYDAFSSGFGPYEQTRMSRETGGIFFMLPTVEQALVAPEKRRYQLEAMYAYYPDLRARQEVIADRDRYPLRALLWKIVYDLDPWNKQAGRVIEMRHNFSRKPADLIQQAQKEIPKIATFLGYLQWAEKTLIENEKLVEDEISPRWRANYDLMRGQVVAYQARLIEYGAAMQFYMKQPPTAPLIKGNRELEDWDIGLQKELRAEAQSRPLMERAFKLLEIVKKKHAGTPWAARAEWEMKRGFGIRLVPDYEPILRGGGGKSIPIPKL